MKKKLSLLLAAVMVAAMVPVTAFAKTDNSISKTVTVKADSYTQNVDSGAPYLQIRDIEDAFKNKTSENEFQLSLTGAKWKICTSNNDKVTVTPDPTDGKMTDEPGLDVVDSEGKVTKYGQVLATGAKAKFVYAGDETTEYEVILVNDRLLSVKLLTPEKESGHTTSDVNFYRFPILAQVTGETATVTIQPTNNSEVSYDTFTFANTVGSDVTAKAGDMVNIEIDSEKGKKLEPITFTETVAGALTDGKDIKITLHGDFAFNILGDENNLVDPDYTPIVVSTNDDITATFRFDDNSPKDTAWIHISGTSKRAAIVSLSNLWVKATKATEEGDIAEITVSGAGVGKTSLEVGTAVDYAIKFTAEDKKLPAFYLGRQYDSDYTLVATFEELAEDSWWFARKTTLTFPEGIKIIDAEFDKEMKGVDSPDGFTIDGNVLTINGDTESYGLNVGGDKKAKWTVKFTLSISPDFPVGNIDVTVGGPALAEDLTVTVAEAVAPVTFEAVGKDVSIDYRNVELGDIVVKETAAGAVKKDSTMYIYVDKIALESGVTYELVAGDIKDEDLDVSVDRENGTIVIEFSKETHKTPFEIKLSNVKGYLDRSLPVGQYSLKVSGDAIFRNYAEKKVIKKMGDFADLDEAKKGGYDLWEKASKTVSAGWACFDISNWTIDADYVNVITAARDQDDSSFTTKVAITIGSNTMVVGRSTVALDVPAYIANGYTMLPVRAVADALSQSSATVLWDDATHTVTIAFGARIISMTIGSDVMTINGVQIKMNKAPEITGGRTFIPLRDLGYALGLTDDKINWDEATSTATLN